MTNLERIQANNAELLECIELAENLPDAAASAPSDPILQEKTVDPTTSKQNVIPDSGYDGLSKVVVNAMPTTTQATPDISVNSSGLITASTIQSAGYVSAGTKSSTKQLTVQAGQTITPGTTDVVLSAQSYLTGDQIIKGDTNLKSENIVSGTSIFGVQGSAQVGSGSGSGGVAQYKTCTIEITCEYEYYNQVCFTVVDNDNIQACVDDNVHVYEPGHIRVFEHVLCGSIIVVHLYSDAIIHRAYDTNLNMVSSLDYIFVAPSEPGAIERITLIEEDLWGGLGGET